MEFQDVVRRRRMVRRYSSRPVDPRIVNRMLDNAVRAPSAGFTQGWSFLVLDEPDAVDRFWVSTTSAAGDLSGEWLTGMRTAPVVIVPMSSEAAYLERYAEPDKRRAGADEAPAASTPRWPVPYWHVDTGMAALLVLQTAVDEGLGACFFGIPGQRVDAFRAEFEVPSAWTPVGAITVGHRTDDTGPAGSPSRRARRPTEEVVHRGRW